MTGRERQGRIVLGWGEELSYHVGGIFGKTDVEERTGKNERGGEMNSDREWRTGKNSV